MADLLAGIIADIERRKAELAPAVVEFQRLQRALDHIEGRTPDDATDTAAALEELIRDVTL